MIIQNLGHASYKIIDDGVSVIFDPYRDDSVPGLVFPKGESCNFVFCSHNHYDHDGVKQVRAIPTDKAIKTKDIIFPHDKENGAKRGLSTAKVIYFSDFCIAHLGDIGDISNAKLIDQLKDADIILCPINGFFTIGAQEAFELKQLLPNTLLIPMHYEAEDGSYGYPDGKQIKIFKNLFKDIIEVNSDSIEITKALLKHGALIINNFKQGRGE